MKEIARRLFSLFLSFVLVFSTVERVGVSAATTDTKYSVKNIQNGGFDENADKYSFSSNYTQPVKTNVPYWDTTAFGTGNTGTQGKFEFFKGTSDHFKVTKSKYPNKPEYQKVAEGEVAAELNADEESTIYQRINTISGSTYTWGLYHRGRDTTDRMALIIGPEQTVDPSKPSKTGKDQFVRITNWLKNQYGVIYPDIGCSKKYSVYTKPFAESGKFQNESSNEDENISMVESGEINQEWSIWVISSPYCNTSTEHTKNGWSAYGTNAINDFDDIIKGASSSLGYDCTYTVPKGQTNTLFAFCSYESGQLSGSEIKKNSTYGNLLDGINFTLYHPLSTSITEGGEGGADDSNIVIHDNILNGDALHTMLVDGKNCTIYTSVNNEGNLKDCAFSGAYVTVNNADGTSSSKFVTVYTGDISGLSDEEIEELSKQYFIQKNVTDAAGKTWKYFYKTPIDYPTSVHLIYTKAPFVLYNSNGGQDYFFSPDNTVGGNLVGFANHFQKVYDKDVDGEPTYVDTSAYYYNYSQLEDGTITPGKYISHAALPNKNWETNDDGTSPHKFCGWSTIGSDGKQIIFDGVHTVEYNPTDGDGGQVSFTDSDGTISNLLLDASHGITLTALWKFVHRAQAQVLNSMTGKFYDSAIGGTVEETLISNELRSSDVKEYTQEVNGENRVECVDAAGNAGDRIMFKANPDYANNYMFLGWYYREKQEDGTYKDVLRSTATSIAVTIEEGKLNTYYARFQKKTAPVVFHYTSTGSPDDYAYYDKSTDYIYGKYFQEVPFGDKAVKPTGDSKSVKVWFTSPTERGSDYIFDFENTTITEKTNLYAGPSFTYNYYNYFVFQEPWRLDTYGTLKFNGNYIDMKTDADITDYNVYMLKGTLGESAPTAKSIKKNQKTIKIGMSVNNEKVIFSTLTNTGKEFHRIGAVYDDFYLFNMKTPIWVVFDFTYKGVTYTSTVKDRCLYNDITTYMKEVANGYYTSFPPETQVALRASQTTLLNSIKAMYDAVSPLKITEPTQYEKASSVEGLSHNADLDGIYTFSSTTAIRNIEPWGLKYTFSVDGQTLTNFADYGAVILTDKDGIFDSIKTDIENPTEETTTEETTTVESIVDESVAEETTTDESTTNESIADSSITLGDLLTNENSVMFSKSKNNIYAGENGAVDIYYTNSMLASDYNKNTYVVFFVKDSNGNYYYSNIVKNSYKTIASSDTSENATVSQSVIDYLDALANYKELLKQAENNQ